MTNIVQTITVPFKGLPFEWVQTSDGRNAVRASDMVKALGKNPKDTARLVNQYIFADYKFQSSFGEASRPAWYLYEHGAVQLATRVDSIEAEPLQRYIFDTVVKIFRGEIAIVSSPVHAQEIALPPADVRVKDLCSSLAWLGIDVSNPRFNQELQDFALDLLLGPAQSKALPEAPAEEWLGVAEMAERLGYPINLVTKNRSQLGK